MSLSSAEVRDLKPSEKNKYNNFEKLTLPHGEEDGYGFKPKSKYSVMILKGLWFKSDNLLLPNEVIKNFRYSNICIYCL